MYSISQAVVMYASAGSICTLAPVVPIASVPGGGIRGDEADVPGRTAAAPIVEQRDREADDLLVRALLLTEHFPPPVARSIVTNVRPRCK